MAGQPDRQSNEQSAGNPPPPKPAIIRVLRAFKRRYHHHKRYRNKDQTEHDFNEMIMARWTRRLGIFTFFMVLIAGGTAWVLYETDQTLNRQIKAQIGSQRAYLYYKRIDLAGFDEGTEKPVPSAVFVAQNLGASPAILLNIGMRFFVAKDMPPTLPGPPDYGGVYESWPHESGQDDKWSFCLTAGTLCRANQERP